MEKLTWTQHLAYAVGLMATDGNISPDGRHMEFTSKDHEQIANFIRCLGIKNKIGSKPAGSSDRRCYRVQFGNKDLYGFFTSLGIRSAKSKTIGALLIPNAYFYDFLRGHFDGDGTFYAYYDKRWRDSYMFYLYFYSASRNHINWLRREIGERLGVKGHTVKPATHSAHSLRYAKRDALLILRKMYQRAEDLPCLSRKYLKIKKALSIIDETI